MRKDTDFIGQLEIPGNALYGIHSMRARLNFPDQTRFHPEWYKAMGLVKLACYTTVLAYKDAARKEYPDLTLPGNLPSDEVLLAMCRAAESVSRGEFFDHFIVPAIQGGAGTSVNMNVNEIVSNAAIVSMDGKAGDYALVDPFLHANVFQSTNDVVPTALKLAAIQLLQELEASINRLRASVERLEGLGRSSMRVAYTEMRRAVPSSFGLLFGAYNEALSRDWWRVSRCFERLKLVNLGGGAAGTGLAVPRFFIMEVVSQLQKLTRLPLTRSENLADTTQNLDSLVEVHGMLKSLAVNLEKISSDIRLLSSDFSGAAEIEIPAVQTGSSIMPGKVNPVLPEYVIGVCHKVYSNDSLVSGLCAQGSLDLNPYVPVIGHAFLESIKLLNGACLSLADQLFSQMTLNEGNALENLIKSPTISTALIPYIGYRDAGKLASYMREQRVTVFEANEVLGLMAEEKIKEILLPENLLKLGYSLKDLR
jgi:aspartate ammonia-lyase